MRRLARIQEKQNKANLTSNCKVPKTYQQATQQPTNKGTWKTGMQTELAALEKNKTWKIVYSPENLKTVHSKWVLKIKEKTDGSVEKIKARLVVRGFMQQENTNYDKEIFSPVIRLNSLGIIIALAAEENLDLYQSDGILKTCIWKNRWA